VDAGVRFMDAQFERSGKWCDYLSSFFLRLLSVITPYSVYQLMITRQRKPDWSQKNKVYLKALKARPAKLSGQDRPTNTALMPKPVGQPVGSNRYIPSTR
jgi:hypothetical protein